MGKKIGKLVRDRIPAIREAEGERVVTHVANDEEYDEQLRFKLIEEAEEFAAEPSVEELADVLETIEAIIAHRGYDRAALVVAMREKHERKGGFGGRIILDEVL